MNELQPKIQEIQRKYKNDPQTQNRKLAELYKEYNYNPMSGCLILLIQFPYNNCYVQCIKKSYSVCFLEIQQFLKQLKKASYGFQI